MILTILTALLYSTVPGYTGENKLFIVWPTGKNRLHTKGGYSHQVWKDRKQFVITNDRDGDLAASDRNRCLAVVHHPHSFHFTRLLWVIRESWSWCWQTTDRRGRNRIQICAWALQRGRATIHRSLQDRPQKQMSGYLLWWSQNGKNISS